VGLDIQAGVRAALAGRKDANAVAFAGSWRTVDWISRFVAEFEAALSSAGGSTAQVALVSRNRPQHVATIAAQLLARRTTVMIYAAQSPQGIAADLRRLRPDVVVADIEDWSAELRQAAAEVGAAGVTIRDSADGPVHLELAPGPASLRRSQGADADIAFQLLSSGTTGAPKRTPLSWDAVSEAVADAKAVYAPVASDQADAPSIVVHPLGNVAGVTFVVPALVYGRPIVLLEKFELQAWVDVVRDYRPLRASVPPVAIGMLLDAAIPSSDLQSLTAVGVGGGKLDPDLQVRFERTYGIPVLPGFGATEFGGVIANWTIDLHREFSASKRGSVGRARPGVALRIADPDSGASLADGQIGLLEAKVSRIGPDWVRTTDLASLDTDGFLFLHGRADQAINRGGFKVLPESVAAVLRQHPKVGDAIVIGMPDPRLGEVPVAAVELKSPSDTLSPGELKDFARERLLAYQVPARILVVPRLPRTETMKVSLPQVQALFLAGAGQG